MSPGGLYRRGQAAAGRPPTPGHQNSVRSVRPTSTRSRLIRVSRARSRVSISTACPTTPQAGDIKFSSQDKDKGKAKQEPKKSAKTPKPTAPAKPAVETKAPAPAGKKFGQFHLFPSPFGRGAGGEGFGENHTSKTPHFLCSTGPHRNLLRTPTEGWSGEGTFPQDACPIFSSVSPWSSYFPSSPMRPCDVAFL